MKAERWQQVEQLYHAALACEESERGAFLEKACSGDEELLKEVQSLIQHDRRAKDFLESPTLEMFARPSSQTSLEPGLLFEHRFRLIRKLGEGGMGQVWLAEQINPVRRQVALKFLRSGIYDDSVLQRFEAERQSLAIMDHPTIARVFDAGTSGQGQPYFVMEYVEGIPLTAYCDREKLTIKHRLELFVQVCEGVQHAHQKTIIHRDLKPANILVAEIDGRPTPRIIDFGLAKATTSRGANSLHTQAGMLLGTPAYMSPEQADLGSRDIDTRTDVYSLGVILYVLLTGDLPLDVKQWENEPLEVLRKLREEAPVRPSVRVLADEDSGSAAELRGAESKSLARLLRGDLDWITLKALEKERSRRYGSPSELAADINRFLRNEPVVARPASVGYRVNKYIRRHRVGAAAVATLVLLLAGFAIMQSLELRRITRERDRANRERDRAARITDFMTGMFKVSDPNEARGNSVTAREILDKASSDMGTGLAKDPEVQSELMQVMARTYLNLGLFSRAHDLAKRALDARTMLFGPDDPRTLESMSQFGWILAWEGNGDEAEKLERQALAGERRVLGFDDPLTLETVDHLAVIVQDQGHYKDEESLEREVIEIETRKLGPESLQTLKSMNNFGTALWNQGRYAEAEQEYRQLLDVERKTLGPDHPETLVVMGNLAQVLQSENSFAEAEQLYREVLGAKQRVFGLEHPYTIDTIEDFATLVISEGRLAEGEKLHREALRILLRTRGPDHASTLLCKLNLADVRFKEGHVHEAETLERETLAAQARVLGPQNPDTLLSQSDLARTLNKEGRYEEAETLARRAFEIQLRSLGAQHPDTLTTLHHLGTAMAYAHRYSEASKLFRDVIEKQDSAQDKGTAYLVWYSFAAVAMAANRPDDALQYLQEAINRGYKDANALMADDDLKKLRHNPNFQELIAQLRHPPR
jgi:non-specific serine/threonine protein kinase/serine/threonine-protein kinase